MISYHQHHYCHVWIRFFPRTGRGCISLLCILYFLMVKDRTVLNIHGSHHVTQRALAHICKDIKNKGMVGAASRRTMHRERTAFANQMTPFGKLIQGLQLKTNKGGWISIPFVQPAAMLWPCCQNCPEFQSFFRAVLKGQRLQIVAYTDKIVPWRTTTRRCGHCIGRSWISGPPPFRTKMHGLQG